jgi:O-methyltransferase
MIKKLIKTFFEVTGFEIKRKYPSNIRKCWPSQLAIPQTIFEVDDEFHNLYEKAQKETQMENTDNSLRRQRHYVLNGLLKYVDFENGDVCELGCRRGLSAYQIAYHMQKSGNLNKFHIFDSFEGLSEFSQYDKIDDFPQNDEKVRKHFACPEEETRNNLKDFDFIKYYKGWIPDRFDEVKNATFSFVHIDVDLYQPILDSIEFFYPRLQKKGIMVFDDYGCMAFPGAKKAIDEYLQSCKGAFFISLPSGEAFLIKDF